MPHLSHRRAVSGDLSIILGLLSDDALGRTRESLNEKQFAQYTSAFERISEDSNQYLMVVELEGAIVGTCHLTMMPSLTFQGTCRMQIEAVRIAASHRGKGYGRWMILEAISYGSAHGAGLFQLTTNLDRPEAKRFYEGLGFEATHVGMKFLREL